ncbi:hypothetical protein L484_021073 [Morus notabilis]|uniref:Uncharacterized protein n=1 Tax=Morus notabilis TaxID=981085 RepID=W9RPU2_9ROSA|nr:hypothetical protein L484_021073 [Morus notabilis]
MSIGCYLFGVGVQRFSSPNEVFAATKYVVVGMSCMSPQENGILAAAVVVVVKIGEVIVTKVMSSL